ncbi:MAG: NAD-dependent epimerase/dehydratase family protein, partial [Chloroflexota bacterium]
MKILVTGAAGFIGSHLATRLLNRGDEIIGLDNVNDYYSPLLKEANIKRLSSYPTFKFYREDIRNRARLIEIFEDEKFDAVVHLAAMAGVRNAVKFPELYVDVDYNGTQHLMDAARFSGVKNFVFASTSSVYGRTNQIPFQESDPCDRPLQPYAAAKRAAEMLGFTYHYLYGLNVTVCRFFTVYGPNGRPDMMAFLVADSIKYGHPIPLYNSGEMYRDWTYIDDITQGLMRAADKPLGYEILNIGRGEPTYLKTFIEIIEDLAGQKANLIDKPMLKVDIVRTYADIT